MDQNRRRMRKKSWFVGKKIGGFAIHLPALNSYARLQFHEKAERLGFRHDSTGVGDKRHVVLWHSTGCVHISLSVYLGRIHLGIGVGKKSFGVKQIKRKKKKTYRVLEEAEEGAPECMKCGFRTWNDFCPDCGRPTM